MREVLDRLLALDAEIEYVEFKEAKFTYSPEKMGKYFSALSNEANFLGVDQGWMVLGVKDDRTIVGTSITTKTINELKKAVADHTSPRMNFTRVHKVVTASGTVLLFEIPKAPMGQVVSWKGIAYGRDGESLGGLQDQKRTAITNQVLEDWSHEVVQGANIDDLSSDAIAKARKEYKVKHQQLADQVDNWDDITFLNKSKVAIKGKLTRAAILLLGKPESEHYLSPATSELSWILKDQHGVMQDYEHFTCPLILAVDQLASKIRILKYRYIVDGTLFPQEVDQYDPYLIREALNNCIAHQDYTRGGKVTVVERLDSRLIFSNHGDFIPTSVEQVVISDAPEERYRNKSLASAMVNYGMIDTVGSGIRRMFTIQREKYFPLPDYDTSDHKVVVTITGKVVDTNYARKLATIKDLSLSDIMLLDKVAKRKEITTEEAKDLRSRRLIEGRKPNYIVAAQVADATGEREKYIRMRGFKDAHYKSLILEMIDKYGSVTKSDIRALLTDLLPRVLSEAQKTNKINNIMSSMSRKDKSIKNVGSTKASKWVRN